MKKCNNSKLYPALTCSKLALTKLTRGLTPCEKAKLCTTLSTSKTAWGATSSPLSHILWKVDHRNGFSFNNFFSKSVAEKNNKL